ncbi:MAG: galactonate dehydratase [Aliiglaciecola sp.]
MKISAIKTYAFWAGARNICLVKVETDTGTYGWGESGLSGRELAVKGAIEHFRHFLIGKDARNIGALWQEMYRGQYFEGGRVLSAAIAAIDIALHDLLAKSLGVPVYQLLGGKQRDHIPLFVTSTLPFGQSLVDDVVQMHNQGWQVIRLTTGEHGNNKYSTEFDVRKSIAQATACLIDIRSAVGEQAVIGIDYHHRLSVPETLSFLNKMPDSTLDFVEEPIRCQTPQAYACLRQASTVPFAVGEEFTSKWDFAPYIEQQLTNFARIDVCNAGGLTESMKIAAMCEAAYIDMMPHNPLSPLCTAASIHFCASINNLSWLEVLPYQQNQADIEQYFVNAPAIDKCALAVNDKPGLGIDVNEDMLQGLTFKPWEPPRLHSPDGAYTNW